MLPIALFSYAFALWLGLYLLARDARQPLLRFTGAGLVTYALAWAAVILDALWVAGSYALLLGDWLPLTTAGRWIIFLVAEVVFVFAVVQAMGIRRMKQDD